MGHMDHMDGPWTAISRIDTGFVHVVHIVQVNIDINNK